jgi:hypothetical protein
MNAELTRIIQEEASVMKGIKDGNFQDVGRAIRKLFEDGADTEGFGFKEDGALMQAVKDRSKRDKFKQDALDYASIFESQLGDPNGAFRGEGFEGSQNLIAKMFRLAYVEEMETKLTNALNQCASFENTNLQKLDATRASIDRMQREFASGVYKDEETGVDKGAAIAKALSGLQGSALHDLDELERVGKVMLKEAANFSGSHAENMRVMARSLMDMRNITREANRYSDEQDIILGLMKELKQIDAKDRFRLG